MPTTTPQPAKSVSQALTPDTVHISEEQTGSVMPVVNGHFHHGGERIVP